MEPGVGVKFHGTFKVPWNFPYDIENFHGIPWNCKILILINFIIREVYFVCCMILCYHISGNQLVVEILRHHSYKAIFDAPNFVKWLYSILNGGLLLVNLKP